MGYGAACRAAKCLAEALAEMFVVTRVYKRLRGRPVAVGVSGGGGEGGTGTAGGAHLPQRSKKRSMPEPSPNSARPIGAARSIENSVTMENTAAFMIDAPSFAMVVSGPRSAACLSYRSMIVLMYGVICGEGGWVVAAAAVTAVPTHTHPYLHTFGVLLRRWACGHQRDGVVCLVVWPNCKDAQLIGETQPALFLVHLVHPVGRGGVGWAEAGWGGVYRVGCITSLNLNKLSLNHKLAV